ncbi:MAG: arylsulfatase A-like enzyme [Granulosicoccus sp.]
MGIVASNAPFIAIGFHLCTMLKKWLIICSPILILLIIGFWPLADPEIKIDFDKDAIGRKQEFLAGLKLDTSKQRPNILLILADDLGKTDISLYGDPPIQTPNIDAIGLNGVTFNEGYITSPICAPSRAGLMTGRYQQRFGFEYQPHDRYPKNLIELLVYKNFIATGDWRVADQYRFPEFEDIIKNGMPPSELMLSELLNAVGYATGIVGKWHLGAGDHALPINRGFEYQYGFYEAYSLYMADTSDPTVVNQRHSDFSDPFIWGKGRSGNCAIRRNHDVIEEEYYLTDRIAEEANAFLDLHQEEPFFLYVPFLAPHTPFQATKTYYDKLDHIEDRNKRVYNAMIWQLDDAVGSILTKLNELGLEENTLVIFMSDNGGATYTYATDNAPLKGGKFTNFEGGLNVPFMMNWKGKLDSGQVCNAPVMATDIFATVASMINVSEFPKEIDGRDLFTTMITPNIDRNLFWRSGYNKAIRSRNWKLVRDELSDLTVLYDLGTDKNERTDLSEQYPDTVQRLLELHKEWELGTVNPAWPRVMDFTFHADDGDFKFPL